jgi:hypothetical protein
MTIATSVSPSTIAAVALMTGEIPKRTDPKITIGSV